MRHKTALVSALSIVGVLLAGASALGANMGILSTSDGIGELTAVSNTVATSSTLADGTTTTAAAQPELVAYQINGVGVVTIARTGRDLTVDSVEVGSWGHTIDTQGTELSMTFTDADRTVNLSAHVEGGEILVEVWEDDVVVQPGQGGSPASGPNVAGTTVPATTPSTYDDDGYDDDEYGDDEYDDEYDEDDYEDHDDESDDDHHEDEDEHEDDEHEGREDDD